MLLAINTKHSLRRIMRRRGGMKIPKKIFGKLRSKEGYVASGIKICLKCGSTLVSINKKSIRCRQCGTIKKFTDGLFGTEFKLGDNVKIIDLENKPFIYKIRKMYLSEDGIVRYILESKDSPIKLYYYENKQSHLEKV